MDDKKELTWEDIYTDFKEHFPHHVFFVEDYRPYSAYMIQIWLTTGEHITYNYITKTTSPIHPRNIHIGAIGGGRSGGKTLLRTISDSIVSGAPEVDEFVKFIRSLGVEMTPYQETMTRAFMTEKSRDKHSL